jgi:hypothetical protein
MVTVTSNRSVMAEPTHLGNWSPNFPVGAALWSVAIGLLHPARRQGRAKHPRPLSGSCWGGAAIREPRELSYLVPVDVLAEVNTAVTVLETYGPVVTKALRQLDRATTVAWKAVNLAEVTDDEWQLVKYAIGIHRGWEAAYRLVSSLDLPGQDIPPT